MSVVTPDLPELFEEAYERAGIAMRGGYQLRSIRRSLNLLTLEWQNRGLHLFAVEAGELALSSGTAEYALPDDTVDLIEHQLRRGEGADQLDTNLDRISVSTYAKQSSKNLQGQPTQIYVSRGVAGVTATLWPVPDSDAYTLAYYRLKGTSGIASGIGTTLAVPPRFVPAMVAGLALHAAMKHLEAASRVPALKQDYEEQFARAAAEDEDRASLYIRPGVGI